MQYYVTSFVHQVRGVLKGDLRVITTTRPYGYSQEFDPELHEMGFLYEYAGSTSENDFNSFAENIFMGDESFFKTVEGYEKLKAKLDLIIRFYNTINPRFTIEYFKEV